MTPEDEIDEMLAAIIAEHDDCVICAEQPLQDHNGPVRRG